MEAGAITDSEDYEGLTPRILADNSDNAEIKDLFAANRSAGSLKGSFCGFFGFCFGGPENQVAKLPVKK